jgi:S1-C subfamily serine protease
MKSKKYLGLLIMALMVISIFPDFSSAFYMSDADSHFNLGVDHQRMNRYQEAIASYKEAVRIQPSHADAHNNLGYIYNDILGQHKNAISSFRKAIEYKPHSANFHFNLGVVYQSLSRYQEAIASFKEAMSIKPDAEAQARIGSIYEQLDKLHDQEKTNKTPIRGVQQILEEELKGKADRLARERRLLDDERKEWEKSRRLGEKNRQPQQPPEDQSPQSGTGSGFFVSKMGHVITNAHVVKGCKRITVGDNANKQVPAEVVNTDNSNDLALLKLSTLEMASAESKSLIQKLSIAVVPLASKGLLRSEDVRLGEKILVAGYPFGDALGLPQS